MSLTIKYAKRLEKIAIAISSSETIEELGQNAQSIIESIIKVEVAGLFLYNEEKNNLLLMTHRGFTKAERILSESTAMKRHPGWVFQNQKSILINDATQEKNYNNKDSKRRFITRSRAFVPIIAQDKCIGTIGLSSKNAYHFNDFHLAILNFVAHLFGNVYLNLNHKKEQEEIRLKLLASIDEIKKSKELRERFLNNLSHEIRTPLNTIIGVTDIIKQKKLLKEEQELIKILSISSDNLKGLINDILDYSKIEANEIILEKTTFSIKELVDNAVYSFKEKIAEKGITIEAHYDKGISSYDSDRTRINQIILNLLSNAVKFTPKGLIKIEVKILKNKPTSQHIAIEVSDTGIGIAKKKLDRIFEPFHQADNSTTRLYGGTGLGLNLTKELVRLLGGIITVKSNKHKGSSFKVELELPKHLTKDKAIRSKKVAKLSTLKSKPMILVVEDDEFNLFLITKLLGSWHFEFKTANNGKKALEMIKKHAFDLIIMDLQMPVMDGLTATKTIRDQFKLPTPIIGLTANALKEDKERCLQSGMNDYVTKPFNSAHLRDKIIQHLNIAIH